MYEAAESFPRQPPPQGRKWPRCYTTFYHGLDRFRNQSYNDFIKFNCLKFIMEVGIVSIYDYEYTSIENHSVQLSEYKGKVMLIVNTASKCGFTPQYEGLEELYRKYKNRGFTVIGFPCNQFMEQEPGSEHEISEFCTVRYGVTFPLSKKVDVRGETAIPLYQYLTSQKGFEGFGKGIKAKTMELMLKGRYKDGFSDKQIKWNFTKFLIGRDGNVVSRYEPTVAPKDIAGDIEKLL